METTNIIQVIVMAGLLFGTLRYWKWKLISGYDITTNNKSFGVFALAQIISLMIIFLNGIDPQFNTYMEGTHLYGEGSMRLWTTLGVHLFGTVLLYMLSNVVAHLTYSAVLKSEDSIYEELRSENITTSLVVGGLLIAISYSSSLLLLKPYVLDWVSQNVGLLPIV